MKFDISLKYRYIFLNYIKKVSKIEWVELGKLVDVKGGKRLPKGQNVTEEETDYKYIRVDDFKLVRCIRLGECQIYFRR